MLQKWRNLASECRKEPSDKKVLGEYYYRQKKGRDDLLYVSIGALLVNIIQKI